MKTFFWWLPHDPDNIFYKMWVDAAKEGSDKTVYYTWDGAHVSETSPWPTDDKGEVSSTSSK
jgi:hypothetical protein